MQPAEPASHSAPRSRPADHPRHALRSGRSAQARTPAGAAGGSERRSYGHGRLEADGRSGRSLRCQVEASGRRGQQLPQPVAELGNRVAQGEQPLHDCRAAEVECVSGVVDVAGEDQRLLAAQRKRDSQQIEAIVRNGSGTGSSSEPCAATVRGQLCGRRGRPQKDIAQRDGVSAQRGQTQRLAGELQLAGPGRLLRVCCCLRIRFAHASAPASAPSPAASVGVCGVATLSQSKKVRAGSDGSVRFTDAAHGRRTSGTAAVIASRAGSEEPAGGRWHSIAEKVWKLFSAMAWQPAESDSSRAWD